MAAAYRIALTNTSDRQLDLGICRGLNRGDVSLVLPARSTRVYYIDEVADLSVSAWRQVELGVVRLRLQGVEILRRVNLWPPPGSETLFTAGSAAPGGAPGGGTVPDSTLVADDGDPLLTDDGDYLVWG